MCATQPDTDQRVLDTTTRSPGGAPRGRGPAYLEAFVLKHLLDGHQLARVAQLGLVDDAEGAVPDDFGVRVADLLRPVGALARRGHHRRDLAAVFIPW